MVALYFVLAVTICLAAAASLIGSKLYIYCRAFVALAITYGLIAKPLFVHLDWPSRQFIDEFVLYPLSIDEYWAGSVVLLIYYSFFLVAMIFSARVLESFELRARAGSIHRFRLRRVSVAVAIGLAGVIAFFAKNPEFLRGASKSILATEDIASYDGSGVLRVLCSALYFVPFLMLVNIRNGYRVKQSMLVFWFCAWAWIVFNFLSDQRGGIIFSAISWGIAYNMFVSRVRLGYIVVVGSILGTLFFVRTAMRVMADDGAILDSLDEIVGNYIGRNLVENGKSLIIMDSIPQALPHAYGSTYLDSLLILVPRAIFAGKQTVNLDTVIGGSVFGCDYIGACAVPPGLIAESYLNFGFFWVMVMMILAGWFTSWLDWKARTGSVFLRIFYCSTLVYFGIGTLGSGVSSFITEVVMHGVMLVFTFAISLNRLNLRST